MPVAPRVREVGHRLSAVQQLVKTNCNKHNKKDRSFSVLSKKLRIKRVVAIRVRVSLQPGIKTGRVEVPSGTLKARRGRDCFLAERPMPPADLAAFLFRTPGANANASVSPAYVTAFPSGKIEDALESEDALIESRTTRLGTHAGHRPTAPAPSPAGQPLADRGARALLRIR